MTRTLVLLLAALASAACDRSSPPPPATAEPAAAVDVVKAEAGKAVVAQLTDHVRYAKSKHEKAFAFLTAGWCPPCQKLHHSLDDPRMIEAFKGTAILELDVDAFGQELQAAGMRNKAIPAFYELDDRGAPTGRVIDGGAWGEDTPENMAPPLAKFFQGKG